MPRSSVIIGVAIVIIVLIAGIWYYYSTLTAPTKLGEPVNIKFATNNVGTSWYLFGGAASEIFEKYLPAGSKVDVLPYAAGVANPILVHNKSADIGLAFTLTVKLAYEGLPPYTTKMDDLRLIAAPIDTYWFGFAATSYSDVESFEDIINPKHPIKIGTSVLGGLAEYEFRLCLEKYGLTYDDLKAKGVSIMYASMPTLIKEAQAKRLDVIIWVVNPGHPSWSELFINPGMRFIDLPDDLIEYLKTKYGLKPSVLKEGFFPGSNEAKSVEFNTIIIARSDMPNELAYTLAKALSESKEELAAAYPACSKVWDPSKWKENAVIPYHTGAEKYYKEQYG